jgi:CRISPR/Cas system-associated exonuclease Cas4 (RecB family)
VKPEQLIEKFFVALREESKTHPPGRISVTLLAFPCTRRAVIELTSPEAALDPSGLIKTWVGTMCHKTSVLRAENELELEWERIYGKVDEYDPATGILLEKKTTRRKFSEPPSHYVKQVQYYRVLLEENSRPVREAWIMFANIDDGKVQVFPVELEDIEAVKAEMLEKRDKILKAVEAGILPPREMGFWESDDPSKQSLVCNYCRVFSLCLVSDVVLGDARAAVEEAGAE